MKISVELSLYSMTTDPVGDVLRFIDTLKSQDLEAKGIELAVNQMSTQVCGELGVVLAVLERALESSFAAGGTQALVAKILNKGLPLEEPPVLESSDPP